MIKLQWDWEIFNIFSRPKYAYPLKGMRMEIIYCNFRTFTFIQNDVFEFVHVPLTNIFPSSTLCMIFFTFTPKYHCMQLVSSSYSIIFIITEFIHLPYGSLVITFRWRKTSSSQHILTLTCGLCQLLFAMPQAGLGVLCGVVVDWGVDKSLSANFLMDGISSFAKF